MSTPSDYLSSLVWGVQASAGAAVSAETTTTLGTNRLDTRVPPDQYRISGLQLAQMRTLIQTMSEWYKGGSRLRLLKLSANPFSSSQYGLFADNTTVPNLKYYDGTNNSHVAAAPLTTKGDLIAFNGSNFLRLGVGANDTVLTADSAQTGGIKWATVTATGDIEGVTAGAGLTGGGTSGTVTLDVGAGTGITVNANDVAVDPTVVTTLTGSQVLTNKTLTSPVIAAITTSTSNGTYTCGAADGAGFVGLGVVSTNTISNGAARLLKVTNNATVIFGVDPTGNIYMNSGGGAGIVNAGNTIAIIPGASDVSIYGGAFRPYDNAIQANGTVAKRWNSTGSYWFDVKDGAQLTAASSITPTSALHHVTGATTISTLATTNVPETHTANVVLTLIADDGTITWDNGGNIAVGGTISQFFAQDFVWHNGASKWYPVQ